jgi:hypothetical protein
MDNTHSLKSETSTLNAWFMRRHLDDKACDGCWASGWPRPPRVWHPPYTIRRHLGMEWHRADAYKTAETPDRNLGGVSGHKNWVGIIRATRGKGGNCLIYALRAGNRPLGVIVWVRATSRREGERGKEKAAGGPEALGGGGLASPLGCSLG